MAKLHWKSLETAKKKYAALVAEGKTQDEIKALILTEPVSPEDSSYKFDDENAEEILSAIFDENKSGEGKGDENAGGEGNGEPAKDAVNSASEEAKSEENAGLPSKYIVSQQFQDKDDFSKAIYAGTDVSHFDAERLAHLVNIGYVVKQ